MRLLLATAALAALVVAGQVVIGSAEVLNVGYRRTVSFPGAAKYQVASGASKATIISGARVRLDTVRIARTGSLPAGGVVRLRAIGANVDTVTITVPASDAAGQGLATEFDLKGLEMPDGLQIIADSGIEGDVLFVEEPRLSQYSATLQLTLDQVRQILGKGTPHPFHGQAKWGTGAQTANPGATWDSAVDSEQFIVQFPAGFTHKGAGNVRLILGHHQLKNAANTVPTETTLDQECGLRGWLFVSPTSMLSDTWPNDNSVDNLEAVFQFCIDMLGANHDDLHMVGFSLGGQQTSRFAATHRDPAGLMLRSACSVAPDWEQLVWQRKQHNNTNLGQSVLGTLCDPDPGTSTSSQWRSQQQRLDQMGGAWPGGDNLSAVGLAFRASAILAIDPASYAETGPMTSLSPIAPTPDASDLDAATIDYDRSLAASGLWTPHMIFYGEDDALTIIPPLTRRLLTLYGVVNPTGLVGFSPLVINVGTWGGSGAHTWDIFDVGLYMNWIDNLPPPVRLPQTFEYVTHRDSTSSYCSVTKSAANDLTRFRCALALTPGAEGWTLTSEKRINRLTIDASKTNLSAFNFGVGSPLHLTTSTNYDVVIKNLHHVPVGAAGANVGVVTVGFDGPNSIRIQPAGAGAVVASIT